MMSGEVLPCIRQLNTAVCSVVIGCVDVGFVMSAPADALVGCEHELQCALAGYCEVHSKL